MSHLISLDNVSLAFGLNSLLDKAKLQIAAGERVCLIGRNGAGKSSLLKIIEGTLSPDSGEIWRKPHLKIASLSQELPQQSKGTVYEFVAAGLSTIGKLLAEYHAVTQRLAATPAKNDLVQLERLQQAIDKEQGWHFEQRIETVLSRLELDADVAIAELSGGWQRRVALAKALVLEPELLLLDEPTNHLDINAIQWLENQLLAYNGGLLFITHDRALLKRLATRIIELDRGELRSWPGDYENFLRRKDELLHAEAQQNILFDKKLAEEERWIRQGIKARRTRNEGRVHALEKLRQEHSQRRVLQGNASFDLNEAEKSGQLVIEAKQVNHCFADKNIIKDFSLRVMRGDRIGLIGPNGVGKSTLLNILLGELAPEQGTIRHGTKLQIAYFDQLHSTLELEKTVVENVVQGSDTIEIGGKTRHIISYLKDFLFTPQRAMTPAKALSGGERNRLLLARLFSKPANLLVLDEPTNDLDIETLELLEELLDDYKGTLLLVSHDREFLDNVVTSTLVFVGNGKIEEYIGGYGDWVRQSKTAIVEKPVATKVDKLKPAKKSGVSVQKELDALTRRIEKLETEQNALHQKMAEADFYQQDPKEIAKTVEQLKGVEAELSLAYQRWEELEQ